jgi:hypothetical protein
VHNQYVPRSDCQWEINVRRICTVPTCCCIAHAIILNAARRTDDMRRLSAKPKLELIRQMTPLRADLLASVSHWLVVMQPTDCRQWSLDQRIAASKRCKLEYGDR